MTMTVHTQAFMLEFGNILVKSGIRPDVAGQVVAKLHAYEAESGAYPNGHPTQHQRCITLVGKRRQRLRKVW